MSASSRTRSSGRLSLFVAGMLVLSPHAHAEDNVAGEFLWTKGLVKVDDNRLMQIRGGFSAGNGIEIAFSIDRAVFANGSALPVTTFNIVSNGAGSGANLVPTVIQNGMDGQTIRAVTTLTISANSIQVMKQGNVQTLVGNGLTASLIR